MRKVKETVSHEVVGVVVFNLEEGELNRDPIYWEKPYCILLLKIELQPMEEVTQ